MTLTFAVFSGCESGVSGRPTLTGQEVTCYLDTTCTNTRCCVTVDKIDTNMEVKLSLDPCSFKLTIAVDKLSFDANLYDFEYGKVIHMGISSMHYCIQL